MNLSDLINLPDISAPFRVKMLTGRFVDQEPVFVDSACMYALILTRPRRWWWSGCQMTVLQTEGKPRQEVTIFLCKSGRFAMSYADNDQDGSFWRLTEPDWLKQGTDATADYSMAGGNRFEVPGAVTVSPEKAWMAIGGLYLFGGRDTSLNWVEADDLSHIIDDDNAFP